MNNKHQHAAFVFVRLQLGITQQQLADSLGISRSLLAMAETGKRSLPPHTMPLLLEMEKLSGQAQLVERAAGKKEERLSCSLVYNRVNKTLVKRNAAGHSLLRAAAAGMAGIGGDSAAESETAVMQNSQPAVHSIPGINTFDELLSTQAVQKMALAQQLQHRLRQRQAAAVKGQELKVLLAYTHTMIAAENKRMTSLRIPLLKKNAAVRKAKLEYKKQLLEKKLLRFNAPALLRRDLQIGIQQRHVNELDGLLQAFGRPQEALL